ncbi:complex I intermediate-associated protein 30 (CIA30) [Kordia periserrulae]|uniref:Complex I intermediate-associated protein 30 (CIA30) n=1 Tax=Kordia periserrulae TaxID=701523 RepID=A0A2T6C3P7_9FLAO|nr:CIA30 family protein [Kordia periserrulae]PTX62951.1 complex I intermediate-associated protein 30 (CIA30) [Kordia periserrulae]
MTLVDFTKTSDISNWSIVNDAVMGGVSEGNFSLNENGHGVFKGTVRLENNGGFSSIRYAIGKTIISGKTTVIIRLKGDGKTYQFRVKENSDDRHSYVSKFKTSGNWETIEIPLNTLYPRFRGKILDIENFSANQIEELGFLIGNKKKETFRLELDCIELK